ncbi:protease B nonderepressible form [Orbilia brochopaga]|uniref:Protein PBN1 n=1 Tax=Orbilia brochopaga TaxID=3140254 RepID=A0AAV9UVK0_9PEZI
MKRRVTFITPPGKEIPDDALRLTKDGLGVKDLKAIREERFTFEYDELPWFAKLLVGETRELYIRFDNGKDYTPGWKGPFSSRLPPGVHAFVVPKEDSELKQLEMFLGSSSDIQSVSTTYDRFTKVYASDPTATKLHLLLDNIAARICKGVDRSCRDDIVNLGNAPSVDLTYDPTSKVLDITAAWTTYGSGTTPNEGWKTYIMPYTPTGRVEVGIFSHDETAEEEEISLRGQIAVVGEDEEFKPTLFAFPARHHSRSNIFTADFQRPTGLHPKLEVTLALGGKSPGDTCSLNAYFAIPQPFFVDPYQLEDTSLLKSLGITALIALEGETDLEAPGYEMKKWGSTVVLELDTQHYFDNRVKDHLPMEFTLPLHLRYLEPHSSKSNQTATLPWPTVFWACYSEEWDKMSASPFDRRMLGYEEYFPEHTYFYHLTPQLINRTQAVSKLEVPVLVSKDGHLIEQATIGIIAIGFIWVVAKTLLSLLGVGNKQAVVHQKKE